MCFKVAWTLLILYLKYQKINKFYILEKVFPNINDSIVLILNIFDEEIYFVNRINKQYRKSIVKLLIRLWQNKLLNEIIKERLANIST